MRNIDSTCLLCKSAKATQRNSHIFPKFISRSILGNKNIKRAYTIGVDGFEESQDTPKEDHILCPSCEKYFSVLEAYIATRFHNRIRDVRCSDQFTTKRNETDMVWKECEFIEPVVFRLFIYSVIWRCSISSVRLCKEFLLDPTEEESLRASLVLCKSESQKDFLAKLGRHLPLVLVIPFIIFTADSILDQTHNLLFAHQGVRNPYQILLNEYMLVFSFRENETQKRFQFLNNVDNTKIKVGFFSEEFWVSTNGHIKNLIEVELKKSMSKTGENPLLKKL